MKIKIGVLKCGAGTGMIMGSLIGFLRGGINPFIPLPNEILAFFLLSFGVAFWLKGIKKF